MKQKKLVTFMEAARLREWSGQRFNNYVNNGYIPVETVERGRRLFDAAVVMAFNPIDGRLKAAPKIIKEKKMPKPRKTLTPEQLRSIRDRLVKGEKQKYIAPEYNMSDSHLSALLAEDSQHG